MIDPATKSLLYDILRKESKSLIQYLGESYPWTTVKTHALAATLQSLVQEEQQDFEHLVQVLQKKRLGLPYLGAYPMSFTTLNYQDLAFLNRYLVAHEIQRIAELEKEVPLLTDPEIREPVQRILTHKKRHLELLQLK